MAYWLRSSGTVEDMPVGGAPINQTIEVHQEMETNDDGRVDETSDTARRQDPPVVTRTEVTPQVQPIAATAATQLQQPLPQFQMPVPPHLMPVRKFSGKGSVVQWWKSFLTYMTLQGLTEARICQYFPCYLEGNAEYWYNNLNDSIKKSFNLLKEAFLKRFRPTQLNVELMDISQGEQETVDDYIHRVLKQFADADVTENSLMTKAMRGLKPALANIVIPQDPVNMEDLRVRACRAEMTLLVTKTQPAGDVNAVIRDLIGQINELKAGNEAVMAAISDQGRFRHQPTEQNQYRRGNPNQGGSRPRQDNFNRYRPMPQNRQQNHNTKCSRCNREYCRSRNQCLARFETCTECKRRGHIRAACWYNPANMVNGNRN